MSGVTRGETVFLFVFKKPYLWLVRGGRGSRTLCVYPYLFIVGFLSNGKKSILWFEFLCAVGEEERSESVVAVVRVSSISWHWL